MRIYILIPLLIASLTAIAQDGEIHGYRAEVLGELTHVGNRMVQLAEAVPEELYDWRPMEGVRSFREVFLHMAEGNYGLTGLAGYPPPDWYERGLFGRTVTTKDELIEALQTSFDHYRTALQSFTDDDLEETVRWFGGRETTRRAALLSITRHAGEHLGQLIAYARMNNITPPWSR